MVFIVAEIGVNWDGDINLAKNMVKEAKRAGCNAVKFQAFELEQVKNHPESDRLMKTTISKNNIEKINEFAHEIDIEWFCTPMYPGAVEMLEPYVKRLKLRESDGKKLVSNELTPLIKKALDTDKDLIVSSKESPKNCKHYNNTKIKWLYCVPKYPCKIDDLDFRKLNDFQGYSNHCIDLLAPISASILGAEIIEVHITSDKNMDFVDNNISFDYEELTELVRQIRKIEKIKK